MQLYVEQGTWSVYYNNSEYTFIIVVTVLGNVLCRYQVHSHCMLWTCSRPSFQACSKISCSHLMCDSNKLFENTSNVLANAGII